MSGNVEVRRKPERQIMPISKPTGICVEITRAVKTPVTIVAGTIICKA